MNKPPFSMKNHICLLLIFACSLLKGQTIFKHTAVTSNIGSNWTILDNPATNNNPNALLQVTSDYGANGPYHNKSIGVWYTNGKWTIFNQDRSPMTVNVKFNVMVSAASANAFMHTSTQISGHIATIDHPRLNNNPNAKFLVTQNWGISGPYNNNPVGVYYTGNKWAVYNQNYVAMPANAKFNIVVDDAIFVVTANPPQGNYYFFDNPSTTSKPNAFVFATQYWTGVYNANEIGVWYSNNKWSVYNQSRNPLPRNAKFMVLAQSGTTSTPTPAISGNYRILNRNSNKFVGISGANVTNGAQAIQWDNNNQSDIEWDFMPNSDGTYRIRNMNSGRYLTAQNDGKVVQFQHNNNVNVKWILIPLSEGGYKIKNSTTGKFLAVAGAAQHSGAEILTWDDNNQPDIKWTLSLVSTQATFDSRTFTVYAGCNYPNGEGVVFDEGYQPEVFNRISRVASVRPGQLKLALYEYGNFQGNCFVLPLGIEYPCVDVGFHVASSIIATRR